MFDVQWVNDNPDYTVRVRVGLARSNVRTWDTKDTGFVAAHEFGHMIGLADEYVDPNCPERNPVDTGTIMYVTVNDVASRMMQRIANNIGSNVVPI
jgi:bacillopeptidase F (M6 metalloprotease family)